MTVNFDRHATVRDRRVRVDNSIQREARASAHDMDIASATSRLGQSVSKSLVRLKGIAHRASP